VAKLRVFTGTWNVAGQKPAQSLSDWFGKDSYDMYVIALQEMDLSTEAYIVYDDSKDLEWSTHVEKSLPPSYKKVGSKQLVGMLIMIYIRTDLFTNISEFTGVTIGQGFVGMVCGVK
jgi:phosphatidylinositol-bisphosphatase